MELLVWLCVLYLFAGLSYAVFNTSSKASYRFIKFYFNTFAWLPLVLWRFGQRFTRD